MSLIKRKSLILEVWSESAVSRIVLFPPKRRIFLILFHGLYTYIGSYTYSRFLSRLTPGIISSKEYFLKIPSQIILRSEWSNFPFYLIATCTYVNVVGILFHVQWFRTLFNFQFNLTFNFYIEIMLKFYSEIVLKFKFHPYLVIDTLETKFSVTI